jgi:acyl-ACP thioesterase
MADLPPVPTTGRVYSGERRVRLGDASPAGRLRLDALVRYLQDVSNDDTRDAAMADAMTWVVRRIVLRVDAFPVFDEGLVLRTFCSGTGPRWAERRVSVAGDRGGAVEAVTLWVFVDRNGRPAPLPAGFLDVYDTPCSRRSVRPRLVHSGPSAGARSQPWPLRFADFDVLGHVNNAAYWAAVEELLAARRSLRAPLIAELEFRSPVEIGAQLDLRVLDGEDGGVAAWFTSGDVLHASAIVRPDPPQTSSEFRS